MGVDVLRKQLRANLVPYSGLEGVARSCQTAVSDIHGEGLQYIVRVLNDSLRIGAVFDSPDLDETTLAEAATKPDDIVKQVLGKSREVKNLFTKNDFSGALIYPNGEEPGVLPPLFVCLGLYVAKWDSVAAKLGMQSPEDLVFYTPSEISTCYEKLSHGIAVTRINPGQEEIVGYTVRNLDARLYAGGYHACLSALDDAINNHHESVPQFAALAVEYLILFDILASGVCLIDEAVPSHGPYDQKYDPDFANGCLAELCFEEGEIDKYDDIVDTMNSANPFLANKPKFREAIGRVLRAESVLSDVLYVETELGPYARPVLLSLGPTADDIQAGRLSPSPFFAANMLAEALKTYRIRPDELIGYVTHKGYGLSQETRLMA
ncbi:hypothetical protein COV16_06845 [Candidatus Woesearchaeota archaeon CG10_big_fil_rev_8_21_14_0_10_34_8]|nr:MAG: hypothetical protein COV16_06845 [Candidatus Woesearchaeota archaeon CG10_big_fil_rev_8_21_14_0_10_34_8]